MTADDLDNMSREELDREFTRRLDERILREFEKQFGDPSKRKVTHRSSFSRSIVGEPLPSGSGWPPGVLLEHTRLDFLETLGLDDVRWLVP